ncbi:hypothetical protein HDU97_001551 [Phlyctochytrium planicorne]|nr:hypothetical protein HDU97_001551 [Phlyctochytrium planicorne]
MVALMLTISTSYAQDSDPCTEIGSTKFTTLSKVNDCLDTIQISTDVKRQHVAELKLLLDTYPFTDLTLSTSPPLFPSQINLLQELDDLVDDEFVDTHFEFMSRIKLLLISTGDGHFSYNPACISGFTFDQPWNMSAFYPDEGKPVIKLTAVQFGKGDERIKVFPDAEKFVGATVESIDGVDVIDFINTYAKTFGGNSRTPETRFNKILGDIQFRNGVPTFRKGRLFSTPFLGTDAPTSRKYVLKMPNSTDRQTITVPWSATVAKKFVSSEDYEKKFCTPRKGGVDGINGEEEGEGVEVIKGGGGVGSTSGFVEIPEEEQEETEGSYFERLPSMTPSSMQSLVAGFSPPKSIIQSLLKGSTSSLTGSSLKGVKPDLSKPIVKDGSNLFFMLEDGETGVWVFTTLSPAKKKGKKGGGGIKEFLATIGAGLQALEDAGAKRLLIDVAGNGGGSVCASTFLVDYLVPKTPTVFNNFRLTKTTKAILSFDFFGPSNSDLKQVNVTAPLTRQRGGIQSEFTPFFQFDCSNDQGSKALPPLKRGFKPEDIAFLSDGTCGSACAILVRALRDGTQGKVKSFVYGGSSGTPFTPTTFEGGVVSPFDRFTAAKAKQFKSSQSASKQEALSSLPRPFSLPTTGQLTFAEAFSSQGKFGLETPAEWVPSAADGIVRVEDPRDKILLWNEAARRFGEMGGRLQPQQPQQPQQSQQQPGQGGASSSSSGSGSGSGNGNGNAEVEPPPPVPSSPSSPSSSSSGSDSKAPKQKNTPKKPTTYLPIIPLSVPTPVTVNDKNTKGVGNGMGPSTTMSMMGKGNSPQATGMAVTTASSNRDNIVVNGGGRVMGRSGGGMVVVVVVVMGLGMLMGVDSLPTTATMMKASPAISRMMLSLLMIILTLAPASVMAQDPCAGIGSVIGTFSTLTDVYACLNSISVSPAEMTDTVSTVKKLLELYPFLDLSEGATSPQTFSSKVNVLSTLDTIASTTSISTAFEFHTRVIYLLNSLNDAHMKYTPTCFASLFRWVQPWHITATYPAGSSKPLLKIAGTHLKQTQQTEAFALWSSALQGQSPLDYDGYTVVSIDGVDAVDAVQAFADKYSGYSREADSRFNKVLMFPVFKSGAFSNRAGGFYSTTFLGSDEPPTRQYVLKSPSGSQVTLTVPWIGSNLIKFSSRDTLQNFCTSAEDDDSTVVDGSKNAGTVLSKRDFEDLEDDDNDDQLNADVDYLQPLPTVDALAVGKMVKAASRKIFKSKQSTSGFNINRPVSKDPNNAFYLLSDKKTGVWVLSTFSPTGNLRDIYDSWVANVTSGLIGLQELGATKLIVEVSGNGGGYVCASRAFTNYLMDGTQTAIYNFRVTDTIKALWKTSFYGRNLANLNPYPSGTSIQKTKTQTRAGKESVFSGYFTTDCGAGSLTADFPKLPRAFAAADLAFVSNGNCGSACAIMLRALRDQWSIRTYVYSGITKTPYTPSSFEGGTITTLSKLTSPTLSTAALTSAELALLPTNFSSPITFQLSVNQAFSPNGQGGTDLPAEWVPSQADGWLDVEDPSDKEAVWNAAAAKMAGGASGGGGGGGGGGGKGSPSTVSTTTGKSNGGVGGVKVEIVGMMAVVLVGVLMM